MLRLQRATGYSKRVSSLNRSFEYVRNQFFFFYFDFQTLIDYSWVVWLGQIKPGCFYSSFYLGKKIVYCSYLLWNTFFLSNRLIWRQTYTIMVSRRNVVKKKKKARVILWNKMKMKPLKWTCGLKRTCVPNREKPLNRHWFLIVMISFICQVITHYLLLRVAIEL